MTEDKKELDKAEDEQELKSALEFDKSITDHFGIGITEALGSMWFLVGYVIVFTVWICWNLHFIPAVKPFDPFPFPILEMVVSIFAIVLSVSVLINQNRQGRIEKIRRQVEFEVNVRAENEITKVLTMLHEIQQKMGLANDVDKELDDMKEPIDIKQLHQAIDEKESSEPSLLSFKHEEKSEGE
ncbi:MAG: hypothetical protein JWP37_160 [Mucilaginibacter sp.]|nr:hypothetical protein [Mucilaginibacter sp.]